jgi:hypothetical protein
MPVRRPKRLVRFGVFELDPASGDLWKGGRRVKLQNQPRQALHMLVERPGELVTREELHRQLWPEDTLVDFENGLNVVEGPGGIRWPEHAASFPGAHLIEQGYFVPALDPATFAYVKTTVHRNLFRIPLR